MKLKSLNKHFLCFGLLLLTIPNFYSQTTFSWNGTYAGTGTNRTYSLAPIGGITMSATIVNSENVFQDASPRFFGTGSTITGGGCSGIPAVNQGLLLSTDWSTNTTKTITTTITFSHTVGAVRFKLYDINDDGYDSWNDRIIITATNNAGTAVNIYSEGACTGVTGNGSSTLTYTSGITSGCTCNGNNSVRVGNDGNGCSQIKTITITYRSAALPTNYNNPKQYVVISDLIANCAPLPIELASFTGEVENQLNLLKWETASERNNSHFLLERSVDGIKWDQFSTVSGAGTTALTQYYKTYDTEFENILNYYRLTQVDFDGTQKTSDIIVIDNSIKSKVLEKIINTLGQIVDETYKGLKIYVYTDGTIIKKMN